MLVTIDVDFSIQSVDAVYQVSKVLGLVGDGSEHDSDEINQRVAICLLKMRIFTKLMLQETELGLVEVTQHTIYRETVRD